jgi:hypothetical protein
MPQLETAVISSLSVGLSKFQFSITKHNIKDFFRNPASKLSYSPTIRRFGFSLPASPVGY